MNDEITKIMRKRRPTGADLGRLIFFLDIESLLAKRRGEEFEKKTQVEQFHQKFLKTFDDNQMTDYLNFFGLYNIVHTYNYLGQGFYQQAVKCFYHILVMITERPSILSEFDDISKEFDACNIKNDVDTFLVSLKNSFAIDMFFRDMEEVHKLQGLRNAYGAMGDLENYIKLYNGIVAHVGKKGDFKLSKNLPFLSQISEKDYLPLEQFQREAKAYMRDIRVFNSSIISTKFFNAYLFGVDRWNSK